MTYGIRKFIAAVAKSFAKLHSILDKIKPVLIMNIDLP